MATTERWDDIVALVSQRGFVTVGELSRLCDVSEVTVRRDLQALHLSLIHISEPTRPY